MVEYYKFFEPFLACPRYNLARESERDSSVWIPVFDTESHRIALLHLRICVGETDRLFRYSSGGKSIA